MSIKSFEDILVWQKGRALVTRIYQITSRHRVSNDAAIVSQARRAAVLIVLNIAEGFERDGNKEFIQFLSIAKDLQVR